MSRPSVRLFGAPALRAADGREVPLAAERRNQMLAYLGCARRWARRDELAALLWTDRDQSSARSNLRFVVMQARRAGLDGFETHGDTLRWRIASDVEAFETAVTARDWAAAVAARSGALLEGFELGAPPAFGDWLRFERARLDALWRDAVAERLSQLAADPPACAMLARQVLQEDPLDEAALAAYLRSQRALGEGAEALRAWNDYVERLAREHGVEPGAGLRALAAGLAAEPDRRERAQPPPAPRAECIGRRLELAQVRQLLADDACRLLTITGAGGVGKSALARAAMSELAARFGDGAAWIALEDLAHTGEVGPRIAATLGLALAGTDAPLAQVGRQLSGRHLLLVFDNAEHLADFGRSCETLAAAAPHAKLLVTSRVRLGARGEWLLPIDGLPLPDRDEHDAGVLRVFDAVALFEARARSLAPGFDLAAQAADVVALCHAVEGLPLALELAAAWTRVLPVAGIVRELRHSLDLLAAPAGAGTRDRSLRASFEHSWRLLAPAEREVLPRLAVFAGSFSRAAAEAVARAALPVLAALVDKSLLRASGDGRFSLHPLLRQCAAERAPDAHAVRIAHAEHYATLLANQAVEDPARVLSGVELELPNLLLAWQTAIDARLAPLVERMAAPLGRFFDVRARFAEGEQVMRGTMPAFGGGTKPERRALARVRLVLGTMQLRQARFADCEDSARLALRGFIATRDRRGMAGALNSLGVCAWQRGHYDDAIGCLERGARRARADGDDVQADRMEVNVALVEEALGHYERAVKRLQACVASQRRTGRELDLVQTLNNIAGLHRLQQQPAAAIAYLEESMQLAQELGHLQNQAHQLANLALAWIDCGDADRAQPLAQQALTLAREHGARQIEVVSLLALSRTAFAKGDVARARSDARAALRVAHELGHEVLQLSALATRAWIDAPGGADAGAAVLLQFVIFDRRTEAHDRNAAGAVLASLALPEDALRNVREAAANMTLGQAVAAILAELRNCG